MFRLAAFWLVLSPVLGVAQELPQKWVGARSQQPEQQQLLAPSYGLTRNDFYWLREAYPDQPAAPVRVVSATVRHGVREASAAVVGCNENIQPLCGIATTTGKFLQAGEVKSSDNVAVVNQALAEMLKVGVTDHVKIDGGYYQVVGVCKSPRVELLSIKQLMVDATELGTPTAYIPYTTMKSRMGDFHVTRNQGSFEGREFQLSEIWIANASALRMRTILQSLRTDDQRRRGDYRVGETIRAARNQQDQ